jgi:hypothetical protein
MKRERERERERERGKNPALATVGYRTNDGY